MPAAQSNGRNPASNHAEPLPPDRCGIDAIINEAEALRLQLQEAGVRIGRLLAALKNQRRQNRAVQAAMASLQRMHLPH
jgi:hypothetical protein